MCICNDCEAIFSSSLPSRTATNCAEGSLSTLQLFVGNILKLQGSLLMVVLVQDNDFFTFLEEQGKLNVDTWDTAVGTACVFAKD